MASSKPPPQPSAAVFDIGSGLVADNHLNAAKKAMEWLSDRHRKGWRQAFTDWLNLIGPEKDDPIDEMSLSEDGQTMLAINGGEWLLARGEIRVKGEIRRINAHLLGRDGPWFSPLQQRWIAQLAEHPLRLWRVTEVRRDEGLTLVDAINHEAPAVVVQERRGSQTAQVGMLMGARLMDLGDHTELSGAIYPFTKLHEAGVLLAVGQSLSAQLHPENSRDLAELQIARMWLAQWTEAPPMPELRDAGTGDAILLVTDHYRVLDAAALAHALAQQPDVSGNPADGWHRETQTEAGLMRSLLSINPGRSADRIELFARTQNLADSGRVWLDALAGAAVSHLTREVTDPRSAAVQSGRAGPRRSPVLPPKEMSALFEQFIHRQYARWADEPIPVLGHQTPRQAAGTAAGLERVKGLLREYEANETRMAANDQREPVSFQFLWDAAGIMR